MTSVRVLPVVLSFLAALFLVGCGDGGGSDDKGSKARIVAFLAEPDTVVEGESTTLQWVTKNAVSVMLVQDGIRIGTEDLPTSGSFVVTPTRNSVFRLEAADREGRIAEAQVQGTVEPFGAPRIDRFVANPGLVNKGETVKLEWKVRAAESLEIVSELGNRIAMFVPAPAEGSYEVRPTDTSKYVLRARNGMGQDSKEAEVIVAVRPKVSLALDKKEVRYGEEVTLSWTVADAETLAIFDPTGEVVFEGLASNGSTTVEANRTGSYRAIAIGMGGEEQVEVRVEVEPVIDEFKVEAQGSARPGAFALASWRV